MKSWKNLRLKIEYVPLSSLRKFDANPRHHSEEQLSALEATIDALGFNQPIGVDDELMILTGHGRAIVAERLGYQDVPVVKLSHLTPEQQQAYITLDNKMSDMGGWNNELLAIQLDELSASFDFEDFGFSKDELEKILGPILSTPIDQDLKDVVTDKLQSEDDSEDIDDDKAVSRMEDSHECPRCGFNF